MTLVSPKRKVIIAWIAYRGTNFLGTPHAFADGIPPQCKGYSVIGTVLKGDGPELSRLDAAVHAEIDGALNRMPDWKRRRVIQVLAGFKEFPHFLSQEGSDLGGISHVPRLALNLQKDLRTHPLGRMVLVHEFDHIERSAEGPGPYGHLPNFYKLLFKRGHAIDFEATAFDRQQKWIRSTHTHEDWKVLSDRFPEKEYSEVQNALQAAGVLKQGGIPRNDRAATTRLQSDSKAQDLFQKYIKLTLDKIYIDEIERALSMSPEQYRVAHLEPYLDAQDVRMKFKRDLGIALLLVGGTYLAEKYANSK